MSESPVSAPPSGSQSRSVDLGAAGVSGLCLIHCLALPFLAGILPLSGVLADNHLIHQVLVLIALPISLYALVIRRKPGGEKTFLPLILIGLALLISAAFVDAIHDYETPLTVLGAILVAFGHLLRWRRHNTTSK